MRTICLLLAFVFLTPAESAPSRYELFSWERGIGLERKDQPELKGYLWFYEWNMFGAVNPEQHSRGDWENKVTISEDGQSAEITVDPCFTLLAATSESGADLTLFQAQPSPEEVYDSIVDGLGPLITTIVALPKPVIA